MIKLRSLVAIAAGVVIVGGCSISSEVDALKKMPTKGDAFMHALHMEYASLAGEADARSADESAEFFYNNGKMAAAGKKVGPLDMKARKLPKGVADDVEAARWVLVALLKGGGPKKSPNQTARAQASFDCWMDEAAKEKPNKKVVDECRNSFDRAYKIADEASAK